MIIQKKCKPEEQKKLNGIILAQFPQIKILSLNHMEPKELKKALTVKTIQFEIAMEAGKTHSELLQIYKELKELQYQQTKAELEMVTD